MESKKYATDLSDDEWGYIKSYLPVPTGRGRPKIHGSRAILDAVFYILKTGCPWRLLPKDFPPWKSVYDRFRKWRIDGTFERLNAALRELLRKPPKPIPEKVAQIWTQEWAKEGKKVDWQRLMPPRGYVALPRRWVVERTFSWLGQNRRMSKDYERLCASAEAFIYAAMIRLMVRRLARA